MAKRKIWTRLLIAAAIILIGWVVFVSSKQIQRNRHIQEEVAALETEAQSIRRENETLSERISYLSSSDFREQEAKEKLGLKKAEETFVVIKPAPVYQQTENIANETARDISANSANMETPNYKKWWKIFF